MIARIIYSLTQLKTIQKNNNPKQLTQSDLIKPLKKYKFFLFKRFTY